VPDTLFLKDLQDVLLVLLAGQIDPLLLALEMPPGTWYPPPGSDRGDRRLLDLTAHRAYIGGWEWLVGVPTWPEGGPTYPASPATCHAPRCHGRVLGSHQAGLRAGPHFPLQRSGKGVGAAGVACLTGALDPVSQRAQLVGNVLELEAREPRLP